jgi:thymidylate kinase
MTVFSFSGIDGAGKSTQIEQLRDYLQSIGQSVRTYTFWDDVVAFSKLREGMSLSLFKGEKGVGSPDRPIRRRDKNVSSRFVVVSRLLLYALDIVRLWLVSYKTTTAATDAIIFDRYIYDELANLPLKRGLIRLYVRFLIWLTPKPDIAFLIDADPETACTRKPEYPLEFVRLNRETYLNLAKMAGMTILPAASVEEAATAIRSLVSCSLAPGAEPRILPLECPASSNSANGISG